MDKGKEKAEWIPDERRMINGVMVHGDTTHAALLLQISPDAADQFARDPHLPPRPEVRLGDILTGEFAPPVPAYRTSVQAAYNEALTQIYGNAVWQPGRSGMMPLLNSGFQVPQTGQWLFGYHSHDPS